MNERKICRLCLLPVEQENGDWYHVPVQGITPKHKIVVGTMANESFKKPNRKLDFTAMFIMALTLIAMFSLRIKEMHLTETELFLKYWIFWVSMGVLLFTTSYFLFEKRGK